MSTSTDVTEPDPASAKLHPLRALRHHNFRLYWASQFVSLIGSSMQILAMAWLIVQLVDPTGYALLHHSAVAVERGSHAVSPSVQARTNWYSGCVSSIGGLPVFLLTLYAGVVADRVDKRKILIVTQTGFVLCSFALGMLCVTGQIEIWQVLVAAGLIGTLMAFDQPSQEAITVDLVGAQDLPSAIALGSVVFNVARSIGPAIGGVLLASRISIGASFLANAACTLCSLGALLLLRLPKNAPHRDPADFKVVVHNMLEGFRYVRSNHAIRNICLLVGSFGMFAFAFNVLVPVFIRFVIMPHASDAMQARAFGYLEMGCGIGAIFGAVIVASWGNPQTHKTMLLCSAMSASLILLLFAFSRSIWIADVLISTASGAFMVSFATCNTLVQSTAPDALRGRVISIYMLMILGTEPIGSLLAGWMAKDVGPAETMAIFGSISLAVVISLTFRKGGLLKIAVPAMSA